MVKPKHLIPSQGEAHKLNALAKIAQKEGYKLNDSIHIIKDGERLRLL